MKKVFLILSTEKTKKTLPHDFGHTGGLEHPNHAFAGILGYFISKQHMKDGTQNSNLMYQSGYQKNTLKDKSDGNEVNENQIEILQENYSNGDLNQENIEK